MDRIIISMSNNRIKLLSSLFTKKYREKEKTFVVEGEKFADEIPAGWEICFYLFSESFAAKKDIRVYQERAETFIAKDSVFNGLSDTRNPQGIMAAVKMKPYSLEDCLNGENPLVVLLEEINDPGNLGAIIRTGDAAGATGIILSKNCADLYSPKVVRSAAGSVFHLPIVTEADLPGAIPYLKRRLIVYAAHLRAEEYCYHVDLREPAAFIIGNEARGLSDEISAMADKRLKIPIPGRAESLNAGMACGLLLYEAVRQRLLMN